MASSNFFCFQYSLAKVSVMISFVAKGWLLERSLFSVDLEGDILGLLSKKSSIQSNFLEWVSRVCELTHSSHAKNEFSSEIMKANDIFFATSVILLETNYIKGPNLCSSTIFFHPRSFEKQSVGPVLQTLKLQNSFGQIIHLYQNSSL